MGMRELKAFIADELLDMARYLESGFIYGKQEFVEARLEEFAAKIEPGLLAAPNDKNLLKQKELIDLFASKLSLWYGVKGRANPDEKKRYDILRGLQDDYIRWCQEIVIEAHQASVDDSDQAPAPSLSSLTERRRELTRILRACAVKEYPGLYILGSFDLQKTIYNQQRRACALVNALYEVDELMPRRRIAIVGGGIGGVTAAVGCALEGSYVDLFEENDTLLHYQAGNTQRYLHPNISEWPNESCRLSRTNLPYLNWEKGVSSEVADQIQTGFESAQILISKSGGKIDVRKGRGFQVKDVEITKEKESDQRLELIGDNPECGGTYDVIVLAIGFGLERREEMQFDTPYYWDNDNLDRAIGFIPDNKQRLLISGTGDGALIDVARAAISNFTHETIEDTLDFLNDRKLQDQILKIEIEAENHFERTNSPYFDFYNRYKKLLLETVGAEKLKLECVNFANADREVTLNYRSGGVFSLRSSPLNRLIVTSLHLADVVKFQRGNLHPGLITKEEGMFSVLWGQAREAVLYHKLIVRWGPEQSYFAHRFQNIWEKIRRTHPAVSSLQVTSHLDNNVVFPEIVTQEQ